MERSPGASTDAHCLILTKLLPVPADNGGKLRTKALVERLAADRPVTIVAFDEGDADRTWFADRGIDVRTAPWRRHPLQVAQGLLRSGSVSTARFWSRTLAAEARRVGSAHPNGVVISEFVQLAPWLRDVPARRRILATQNIESSLVASYAATATGFRGTAFAAESHMLARMERRMLSQLDVIGVVSEQDRVRLGDIGPEIVVAPNGHDPGELLPWRGEPHAVFVAHLGWSPNIDAARWFASEVWPLVLARVPAARLSLVGRSPAPEVRSLGSDSITVTGTVPEVKPYLEGATVALAPLRAGGGTRLKILEALGAGRPVVATTVGAEGLERLRGRGLQIADEPMAMASAIAGLLADPQQAQTEGRRGYEAVQASYSWDAVLAPLLRSLDGDAS